MENSLTPWNKPAGKHIAKDRYHWLKNTVYILVGSVLGLNLGIAVILTSHFWR